MPREMVRNCSPDSPFVVKVGWSNDGATVQIGIETEDDRSLFWQLFGTHLDEFGAAVRQAVAEHGTHNSDAGVGEALLNLLDASTMYYRGVWSNLDRVGCNHLIRVARKARDGAFGRDE